MLDLSAFSHRFGMLSLSPVASLFRTALLSTLGTLLLLAAAAPCWGQKVGDTVVVSAETKLKIKDEDVGTLFPGTIVKVTHARGDWLAVGGRRGWLNAKFVMSLDAATRHYLQRLRQNPQDVEAMAVQGLIYYQLKKYNECISMYNQALSARPNMPQLWNNRSLALIAQARFELAEKDLLKAIELSPEYAEAYANLGWVYSSVQDWESAIQQYSKALELNPEDSAQLVNRGSCFRALGKMDQAMGDFENALKITVNLPAAFVGRSSIFLDRREWEQAIASADRALEMEPTNVQALINRGWANYLKGESDAGLADLNKAIVYDESSLEAHINRSVILLQLGKLDAARKDLDRARELAPEDPVVWLNVGELELEEGAFAKSLAAFEKAKELAPEIAETHNGLAWILATAGDDAIRKPQQAESLATKACQMSEFQDWSHLDTLAAAQASLGKFEEASQTIEKALKLVPAANQQEVSQRRDLYLEKKPFRETGKSGKSE